MAMLAAILGLSLLVIVHEAGHLLAALAVGVRAQAFAVGFGPALARMRWRGIEWRLCALPLGGYVQIQGLNPFAPDAHAPGSVRLATPWRHAAILVAGPAANFLLAAGLIGAIHGNPLEGLHRGGLLMIELVRFLAEAFAGSQALELSGPVGVAKAASTTLSEGGAAPFLAIMAFLSANLCLFNLLPLPALDGGRLALLGLERLRRKPLPPMAELALNGTGFLALAAAMLFVTLRDVAAL